MVEFESTPNLYPVVYYFSHKKWVICELIRKCNEFVWFFVCGKYLWWHMQNSCKVVKRLPYPLNPRRIRGKLNFFGVVEGSRNKKGTLTFSRSTWSGTSSSSCRRVGPTRIDSTHCRIIVGSSDPQNERKKSPWFPNGATCTDSPLARKRTWAFISALFCCAHLCGKDTF